MGSGINISDHIYKSFLLNSVVKLLKFCCGSGSGILCFFDRDLGWKNSDSDPLQ
jgi:hypothetical protein